MQQRRTLTDRAIRKMFEGAGDFVARPLQCCSMQLFAYAVDGLVSGGDMSEYVLKPITQQLRGDTMQQLYDRALDGVVYNAVAQSSDTLEDVSQKLVNGFCVILFPSVGAIAFEVKTGEKRSPAPPEVENTVKGPKDSFVETVRSNTSLLRRHLRTPQLRLYETQVGQRSLTNVSVVYIEGLTDPSLVERMKNRLAQIDIDGFLTPAAVEEYVTGSRATAFPLMLYTQRTDRFCQGLLDGRVGLFVDGLPMGYLAPAELMYFMDSAEDRSRDYLTATAVRILRYLALVVGLLIPGLYIALATFHQAWIPLPLLRSIIESKAAVPFSTTAEVLGLLVAFELLQESGIHLPQAIGQSVSVVGGIVMGTAAVEAGLISPVALIAVSIAGVCGFVLPNRDMAQAVRAWRFVVAVLSAVGGIVGTAAGVVILLIHLSGLRCLGVCYLSPLRSAAEGGGFLRLRLKNMKQRNGKLNPLDRRNQK